MSTQEIIEELPRLSPEERDRVAKALQDLTKENGAHAPQPVEQERRPDLHPGAWWIADDFDDPLPDSFWLGEDA